MNMILITGGSGSGKSAFAEGKIREIRLSGAARQGACRETGICDELPPMYYIATMQVYGAEGRRKVARHRQMRAGKGFETLEIPADLGARTLRMIGKPAMALLECASNLTANEMFTGQTVCPEKQVTEKVTGDILDLADRLTALVVVTNNVFEDGVPYDETTLAYIRALGKINRNLAASAQEVWEVAAGIPVCLKR